MTYMVILTWLSALLILNVTFTGRVSARGMLVIKSSDLARQYISINVSMYKNSLEYLTLEIQVQSINLEHLEGHGVVKRQK